MSSMLTKEYWTEFELIADWLENAPYRFANTLTYSPHCYTMRDAWHDKCFVKTVTFMRTHGYKVKFGSKEYIQFDVNGHFYWTMGDPMETTTLINRKVIARPHPYDDIAEKYSKLFLDKESHKENKEVFALLGDVRDKRVLDVGCGTGLFLRYASSPDYVGIDPSKRMLCSMCHVWPNATKICTSLASFYGGSFDVVCGLFGVGSYLSHDELRRVPSLLRWMGEAFLMFYNPDYTPVTYKETGKMVDHYDHSDIIDEVFPGNVKHTIGNHTVVSWRKHD